MEPLAIVAAIAFSLMVPANVYCCYRACRSKGMKPSRSDPDLTILVNA